MSRIGNMRINFADWTNSLAALTPQFGPLDLTGGGTLEASKLLNGGYDLTINGVTVHLTEEQALQTAAHLNTLLGN